MKSLTQALHSLDDDWKELAKDLEKSHIIANHEAYQYLAKRYQIKISSLDIDPQEDMSKEQRKQITQLKEQWNSKVAHHYFLWESQASATHLKTIADLGVSHILLNPLENLHSIQSFSNVSRHSNTVSSIPKYIQVMQNQISLLILQ